MKSVVPSRTWSSLKHTVLIQFGARQQIKKVDASPINANGDLIPMSYSILYLGGYLDTNLTFSEIQKVKAAMANL